MKRILRGLLIVAGLAGVIVAMVAPGGTAYGSGGGQAGMLAAARRATAKYQNVKTAEADNFHPLGPCVHKPGAAVGIHFVNKDRINSGVVKETEPPILIYQPGPGGLHLVALEYFKRDNDQDLSTSEDRPSLFGRPMTGPVPPSAPGQPIHYEMHVWLWQVNPLGAFIHFNPDGHCPPGGPGGPPPGATGPPPGMSGMPPGQ